MSLWSGAELTRDDPEARNLLARAMQYAPQSDLLIPFLAFVNDPRATCELAAQTFGPLGMSGSGIVIQITL